MNFSRFNPPKHFHSRESANEMKILRKINFFMQIFLILCCCIIFSFFFEFFPLYSTSPPSQSHTDFTFSPFFSVSFIPFGGVFVCNDAIWRVNLNILLIWLLMKMLYDGEGWFASWLPDRLDRSLQSHLLIHSWLYHGKRWFIYNNLCFTSKQEWKWNRKKVFFSL